MSPPFADLRVRPIPDQAQLRAAKTDFRTRIAIDADDPRHGEPLVDTSSLGLAGANFYHSAHNPPYWHRIEGSIPQLLVRAGIGEKLAGVNTRLQCEGLELFLFDAWRPRAVQAYFHDVWVPAELQRRDPSLAGDALTSEVERYWAAPTDDPLRPAPHATGAAVDLTMRLVGGEPLWMGSIFDDATDLAHRDRFERDGLRSFSDEEARANRRLLHWVMTEEGFAGHPDEWWHFSWGDQLWAALTRCRAAFYGYASEPPALAQ